MLAYHAAYLIRTKLKASNIHDSWNSLRFGLNQIHRLTTVMPKSKHRYLVLKVDQNLTSFMERIVQSLGMRYDPAAIRTKEEFSDKPRDPEKPPDP